MGRFRIYGIGVGKREECFISMMGEGEEVGGFGGRKMLQRWEKVVAGRVFLVLAIASGENIVDDGLCTMV